MQREAISQNEVDGYKETEIGTIPAEWDVAPVNSFANVSYGKARPKTEGCIPVVGSGGIYAYADESLVDYSTIVVGRKGNAGQAWLFEEPCWPSDTTFYLEWKQDQDVDVRFLHAYMSLNPLSGVHAKTTLPSLQKADLENFLVPFPPIDEQRRIAAVLSTIQQAISAQEQVIQAARELKRSLMHRLFTYGPYAEPAPTKETEIGDIPEHWKVTELCQLAVIEMGQSPPGSSYNNYGDGVPLINGPAEFTNKYPLAVKWTTKPTKVCNEGDILFCVRGNTTGRMNIADRKYCIGRGVAAISSRKKCSVTEYIRFLLELRASQILEYATAGGSTFPNITKGQLTSLLMPMPPYEEQKVIAYGLSVLDQKTETEQRKKNSLEALFKSMLHQLMTGQIRVLGLELSN